MKILKIVWNTIIPPLVVPVGVILFIGIIILAATEERQKHDLRYDPYQNVYKSSGIFENHPLEPLGPIEISNSQFHGKYFAAFFLADGKVDGSTESILYLQFQWRDPSGAYKYYKYDYEKINIITENQYVTPQIRLDFTKDTLNREIDLTQDLTVYNYNNFFDDTVTITVFMTPEDWAAEKAKLPVK